MTYAQKLHQEGRTVALQENVIDALEIRFNRVPEGLREEINHVTDPARLQSLLRADIQAVSLEKFSSNL